MESKQENPLRHAIIGVGAAVFSMHREALALPTVKVVAVSDINTEVGQQRAAELGCAFYADYRQLLQEVQPEVVVILTPHPLHASIAITCLDAGCHVLVEKPLAVQVAEADAMIAAAERNQRLLGVVFQHRFRPEIRAAYQLIHEGQLGDIQHVELTASWTRTASYYRSATWRGTWKGEGGGVLMNQAPHNLDLLCHLVGQPGRVFGWTRRLIHAIETEDTVQAALEWPGGALGSLHISTAEADPTDDMKIVGTKGVIEIRRSGGKIAFRAFEQDLKEFMAQSPNGFGKLPAHEVPLELGPGAGKHSDVYRNFVAAVQQGTPFMSPGTEGRLSLELANALIYSSYTRSEVDLPLDREKYAQLLDDLRAHAAVSKSN